MPNPIEPAQETGETNAFVEFIKDEEGKLSCKKALELESISAIAARNIAEGANAHLWYERRYRRFDDTPKGNLAPVKRSRTD